MPAARCNAAKFAGVALTAVAWLSLQAGLAAAELGPAELGPGTVAVVSQVEGDPGTITMGELNHSIAQVAAQRRKQSTPPKPGEPRYTRTAEQALNELLDVAYIEGEAAERKLIVPGIDVSRALAEVKRKNFKSEAEYRAFLRDSKITNAEARERIRLSLLTELILADVLRGIHSKTAAHRAMVRFVDEYMARWRERTVCMPSIATKRCSNRPLADAP